MYDIIETLVEVAGEHGHSPAQTALAYLLGKPGVTSWWSGPGRAEQLADNLASATWSLDEGARQRLDDVSALPLLYPYWHQRNTARDRLSAGDLTFSAAGSSQGAARLARPDQAERVAGRVEEHPESRAGLELGFPGAELEHRLFGDIEVGHVKVDVGLLGVLGARPHGGR